MNLESLQEIMNGILIVGGVSGLVGGLFAIPNFISYSRTKEMLDNGLIDNLSDKKNWEKYKEYSLKGKILYCLGYSGRGAAYNQFKERKIKNNNLEKELTWDIELAEMERNSYANLKK